MTTINKSKGHWYLQSTSITHFFVDFYFTYLAHTYNAFLRLYLVTQCYLWLVWSAFKWTSNWYFWTKFANNGWYGRFHRKSTLCICNRLRTTAHSTRTWTIHRITQRYSRGQSCAICGIAMNRTSIITGCQIHQLIAILYHHGHLVQLNSERQ